jgi:PPOX class probable F420-dependent enzyme
MDIPDAIEFIRTHHQAVMATERSDGRPAMSPVIAAVDGDGRVVISTRETAMKVRHLRERPRASLCVLTDGFYGPAVQVEGAVEIVSLPDAMERLVDYYRSVSGEHPDWDEYRAAMEREKRVVVRIDVDRAGPNTWG